MKDMSFQNVFFKIMENAEVNALLKIIGLQYRLKYDKDEDMKTLRYGRIMVMADQVCSVELYISKKKKRKYYQERYSI